MVTDTTSTTAATPSLVYRSEGSSTLIATRLGDTLPLASRVIYSYDSVFFGCAAFTPVHGIFFDPYGTARAAEESAHADIFVTAPRCDYWSGAPTPFDESGTPLLHYPNGGVIIQLAGKSFTDVKASEWHDAGVSASQSAMGGTSVLLFKTRDGRVVKLLLSRSNVSQVDGPYAVQSHGTGFFDDPDLGNLGDTGITF